jgi:hypothetical protein
MTRPATFRAVRDRLDASGFEVAPEKHDVLGTIVIAETLYALVIVIESSWEELRDRYAEAQAHLTHRAAERPSARIWDLYVIVVADTVEPGYEQAREVAEGDTQYARKLIVAGHDEVRRRLRALLPLGELEQIVRTDPLAELERRLVAAGLSRSVVEAALRSFEGEQKLHLR